MDVKTMLYSNKPEVIAEVRKRMALALTEAGGMEFLKALNAHGMGAVPVSVRFNDGRTVSLVDEIKKARSNYASGQAQSAGAPQGTGE